MGVTNSCISLGINPPAALLSVNYYNKGLVESLERLHHRKAVVKHQRGMLSDRPESRNQSGFPRRPSTSIASKSGKPLDEHTHEDEFLSAITQTNNVVVKLQMGGFGGCIAMAAAVA